MPSPSALGLLDEIKLALEKLAPRVRGLEFLERIGLEGEMIAAVSAELMRERQRAKLMRNTTIAIETLLADGFPDTENDKLPPDILEAIRQLIADIMAALGGFSPEDLQAKTIDFKFGEPEAKTKTQPNTLRRKE